MIKKKIVALAITTSLCGFNTIAAEVDFSGYGSIRGGMLLDDNFTPPFQTYTDKLSFREESLFALQASSQINDKWSATILMQASGKNDFEVEARWAYVNYKFSPNTTITAGRFALPFFKSTDTQDIGYSHNLSRLPIGVYTGFDFEVVEGVRVNHITPLGEGDLTVKASLSSYEGDIAVGILSTPAEIDNIVQLSLEYNWEWLSLFAGGFVAEMSTPIANTNISNQLVAGANDLANLSASGPHYKVSADNNSVLDPANNNVYDLRRLHLNEDRAQYYSLGLSIDYNNFLFNTEYANYGVDDSLFQSYSVYYIALGYRATDNLVVTWVNQNNNYDKSFEQNKNVNDPLIAGVSGGVVANGAGDLAFKSNGIHLRYDAAPGIAYKAEFTRVDGLRAQDDVDLVTFGVDFLF